MFFSLIACFGVQVCLWTGSTESVEIWPPSRNCASSSIKVGQHKTSYWLTSSLPRYLRDRALLFCWVESKRFHLLLDASAFIRNGANQWTDGRCWSNRRLVFLLTCLLWFPPRGAPEPGPQSVGRYPCRHRSPQIVFPWAAWAAVPLQVLPAVCGSHQWVKVLPSIPGPDYNTLHITLVHFQLSLHKIPLVFLWLSGSGSWGQKFH